MPESRVRVTWNAGADDTRRDLHSGCGFDVEEGSLVVRKPDGEFVAIYAPGAWLAAQVIAKPTGTDEQP